MLISERHFVNQKNIDFNTIDQLAFKSKNIYNKALYLQNQHYLNHKIYINYNELDKLMQKEECYKQLPAKVSQQVLLNLHRNWLSFFKALESYKKNPSKFNAPPTPPKYKNKKDGRNLLVYTKQAISKQNILSKTTIKINTKKNIKEVRIINKRFGYFIEVLYEKEELKTKKNNNKASIDLGLNNLISMSSNCANALIVNGRILKSINQHCNKLLSFNPNRKLRNEILKKHYFRVKNYLHQSTSLIIKYLLKHNITEVIIGYNEGWKEGINHWKKSIKQNQKMIPYLELVKMIEYKCKLQGIDVVLTEESYTSQSSYYDNDPLPKYGDNNIPKFSGKRIKRGLYRSKDGFLLNADINGSLNIGRKVIHNYRVDRSLVARPLKLNPLKTFLI